MGNPKYFRHKHCLVFIETNEISENCHYRKIFDKFKRKQALILTESVLHTRSTRCCLKNSYSSAESVASHRPVILPKRKFRHEYFPRPFQNISEQLLLTLSRRRPISYRNQSIHLQSKSMDWFLYDICLLRERVKSTSGRLCSKIIIKPIYCQKYQSFLS